MGRARSLIGFVDRYITLAGRNCCAGRSWEGLDRTLDRWQDDPPAGSCQPPSPLAPGRPEEAVVGARVVQDRDDGLDGLDGLDDGSLAASPPAPR